MAQQYFGYYLYSVLYTADPSGIAPFGKTLQNEVFDSFLSDSYFTTPICGQCNETTTGQFDLPGIQIIEPTLEHYLSPDKMTFFPFLGYIYKNFKNIVNAFPQNTDNLPKI